MPISSQIPEQTLKENSLVSVRLLRVRVNSVQEKALQHIKILDMTFSRLTHMLCKHWVYVFI